MGRRDGVLARSMREPRRCLTLLDRAVIPVRSEAGDTNSEKRPFWRPGRALLKSFGYHQSAQAVNQGAVEGEQSDLPHPLANLLGGVIEEAHHRWGCSDTATGMTPMVHRVAGVLAFQ